MPNRVTQALDLLKKALTTSRRKGWDARAARIKKARADLTPPKPAPKPVREPVTTWPGVRAARTQSENGPQFGVGECLMRVHDCYGIGALYHDAAAAWRGAKVKHPETNPAKFPRGYPVFWTGGSHGFGHVAIAAGDGDCWSTDIRRPGFFDRVPISEIHDRWGLTLVGWTEDLNGRPVPAVVVK